MKSIQKLFALLLIVGALSSFNSPSVNVNAKHKTTIRKSISSFEVNKTTFYKVQVKITGADEIKGIAKYEELIPAGYTVKGIFSDCGNANFDSKKAEVTFLSLNGRKDVTITYYLEGKLSIAPKGDAKFQYVKGDDIALIKVEITK